MRWKWTANDGTTLSNPISKSPTVTRSEAGTVSLQVIASNASGTELGRAALNFLVVDQAAPHTGDVRIEAIKPNQLTPPSPTADPTDPAGARHPSGTGTPTSVNSHDLIVSRDGNYRLRCYVVTKTAPNPDQTLTEFEKTSQRDLGRHAQVGRVKSLQLPTSMAGLPYRTDRRVVLYRIAFVSQNRFFVIDALAPVLSDPGELTDVLRTILGTLDMK